MESSVLLVLPIYKVFIRHLNIECFESTVPAIFRFYAPTFFYLSSALMAIDQWGFFHVPHLLWHGPTLMIVISEDPVAERLAVELSLPVYTTWVSRDWESNPDLTDARRSLYLYATAAVYWFMNIPDYSNNNF